jgi:hypothetical protein
MDIGSSKILGRIKDTRKQEKVIGREKEERPMLKYEREREREGEGEREVGT